MKLTMLPNNTTPPIGGKVGEYLVIGLPSSETAVIRQFEDEPWRIHRFPKRQHPGTGYDTPEAALAELQAEVDGE